jgi:FAD:protein FMN transferase
VNDFYAAAADSSDDSSELGALSRPAPAAPPDAISRRRLMAFRLRSDTPGADHWIRIFRRAMACRFEITLSGEDARHISAARDVLDEADRLEAALTVFRESSDLMRINRLAARGPVDVDPELFDLLHRCRTLHVETDGAFDITSTPLSRCWGFLSRNGRVPSTEALDAARATVGTSNVLFDEANHTIRFDRSGVELNLGSIGKGYAVQCIGLALRARGVRHALVSAAASSILAIGGRGLGWCIDLHSRQLQTADSTRGPLARLFLRHGAVGTSAAGEQFVEVEGKRYGHLLDPRTGWPAAAGLLSVSVVTRDAATADALATAFFIGGFDLAERYCAMHSDTLALLTPDDGSARPHIFGQYSGAKIKAQEDL